MGMIKLVSPQSVEAAAPVSQLVKVASRGLLGEDLRLFQKSGAAEDLLKQAASLKEAVHPGETLIHLIAMGSTEATGPNRNGDGFRANVLRQYHPTFVKHAHFYRDHKNTDPLKSYGRVVMSAYNEPMSRAELMVALNGTKEAAARNKGLIADKEMHKLASGQQIPTSMACYVSHDLCSYCGHSSPTTADYCTGTHEGGHCKAGGLRNNIGSLIEIDNGLHHLHADNPHPKFFDISHVSRPADRIAYVTGLLKSAAVSGVVKSAELAAAMCLHAPLELRIAGGMSKQAAEQLRHVYTLADHETTATRGEFAAPTNYGMAFDSCVQSTPVQPPKDFQYKVASTMRALADARVLLPISQFIGLFVPAAIEKAAELATLTQMAVPGTYTRLVQSDTCEQKLQRNPYTAAKSASVSERVWAQQLVPEYSVREDHIISRAQRAALRGAGAPQTLTGGVKLATDQEAVRTLAEQYCLYKLAFLQAIPESELPLTAAMAVMQNYIQH